MLASIMVAVLTMFLTAVIAGGVFAAAAYLGIELDALVTKTISAKETEGRSRVSIILTGGICGFCLGLRSLAWQDLAMAGGVCLFLAACGAGAARTGKMSDYFLLAPLCAVVLADVAQQGWWLLLSPIVPFIPFAVVAALSKERAMGWDDAKLAALGGAILGPWFALLAFATACVLAAVVAWTRKKTREPMLLAPYMLTAIALCLVLTISRG